MDLKAVIALSAILSSASPGDAYAGIGSRDTPRDVLGLMERAAEALQRRGLKLRTGGADGADAAFERGAWRAARPTGHKASRGPSLELFLPWKGFNGRFDCVCLQYPSPEAFQIAARLHPLWSRLSRRGRALHARNSHQILGRGCCTPSKFALLWTPDGVTRGAETSGITRGTGQAIRVADAYGVPVFNLRNEGTYRALEDALDALPLRSSVGSG